MATQYDSIGSSYSPTEQSPVRLYAESVTFFDVLGDIRGKKVLDVACGTGFYSRLLKRAGAQSVLGLDISPEMIRVAREKEQQYQDGIDYQVFDATALPVLGSFDVVTASFLLTYAETKDQLVTMCRNVYKNLIPQGRFVASVTNPGPVLPRAQSMKYGGTIHRSSSIREGERCELEFHFNPPISAFCYYWTEKTMEWALIQAGFINVCWTKPFVSSKGLELFGQEFWQDFLDRPHMVFVRCTR